MRKGEHLKNNLGSELKKVRTQKRLSLEKIEAKLRINVKYLKSIEDNQLDFLHRPYVLAFVKAYANELGLDVEEIKEKFDQQLRSKFETPSIDEQKEIRYKIPILQSSESITKTKPALSVDLGNYVKPNRKIIVVATVLTLFIVIIFFLQRFYFSPRETTLSTPQETQNPGTIPFALLDTSSRVSTTETPLVLRLVTNDRLWLRMSVDNGGPQEFIFNPNETRTWTAQEKFELRIGKSAGFDLYFNDSLLQNLGNENTMIGNLVLTKDGVGDLRLLLQPQDTTMQK